MSLPITLSQKVWFGARLNVFSFDFDIWPKKLSNFCLLLSMSITPFN